jgi:hypothetical protein
VPSSWLVGWLASTHAVRAVQHGVPGDLNATAAVAIATIHCPRTMQYTLLVFADFLLRFLNDNYCDELFRSFLGSNVQKFVVILCYANDIDGMQTSKYHAKVNLG